MKGEGEIDAAVVVRRQWNDWRRATVSLAALDRVHWDRWGGGVRAQSPRPFLHAYIRCDRILEGELAHSCLHGEGPHQIKVCIVKKDNMPEIFRHLLALAGGHSSLKTR